MGCSTGRKLESKSIAPAGARSLPDNVRSLPVVKKTGPKPRIDFLCTECGTSRAAYPNYRHKCEPGPVAYQETRKAICHGCEHNRHGLCMSLRALHPDRPGMISIGIKIPGAKCPEGKWKRTLWVCDDCGSQVFDERGLDRCPVCKPIKEPRPNFVPLAMPSDIPAEPNRPLAVVSVAVGQNSLDTSKITWPRMRKYAEFVGADFVTITDDKSPSWPVANKFRVGQLCSKYSRVLYLDVDTWVMPGIGNVFEQFEPGWLYMFPDSIKQGIKWDSIQGFSQRIADESGYPLVEMKCHNSGVVLFDQKHAPAWLPPEKLGTWWVSEQYWIARRAIAMGALKDFPPEMNTQWYWPDFRKQEPDAKILHLAACPHGERISRLQLYARRYSGDFI